MTDTKESYWHDYQGALADCDTLRAENAKLRAEVDFANERMHEAANECAKLREELASPPHRVIADLDSAYTAAAEVDRAGGDAPHAPALGIASWIRGRESIHRAELAELRKQAEAAATAPSDELQRLLDETRQRCEEQAYFSPNYRALINLVVAMAQRLGAQ